jgi:regulator of PEP synthase PpsR (kinase-PPPase family)
LDQKSTYADRKYILSDLKHAKQLTVEYGFTEIDVTGRAVEETASLIRSMLYDRFGDL